MEQVPNFSYLDEISNGDYTIMMELISIFKKQIPEFIDEFNKAISEKNYKKVAAIAHKAKSSVEIFGLHKWAEILEQLQLDIDKNIVPENLEQMIIDFENDSKQIIEKAIIYAEKNK